jgi:uncharacterized membrane protein
VTYSGAYALVLVLHLLAVVFVIGPVVLTSMQSARYARTGQAAPLRAAARSTRLYGLATVATVLLGSAMIGLGDVGGQWEFSQAWISASYALWLVATVLTLVVVVPAQTAAADALETGQGAADLAKRISIAGGVAALAWVAIIVLMVWKPGA